MKLLKRKKEKELHPFIIRLLAGFNQGLLRCACYLQRKTNGYSRRKRKWILFVFCFVFVTESIVVVFYGLQQSNRAFVTVAPIRSSPTPNFTDIPPVLSAGEFRRIEQFKHYLDSNSRFRDSLLAVRPHLMDTLTYLQKIYTQNGK